MVDLNDDVPKYSLQVADCCCLVKNKNVLANRSAPILERLLKIER